MTKAASENAMHRLKNHLAVIIGFCDLLVEEAAANDPRRPDFLELQQSARAAMAILPEVARAENGDSNE
jgi:hypothetical protein